MKELKAENPSHQNEGATKNKPDLTKCSNCYITIAKRTFSRYKKFFITECNNPLSVTRTLEVPRLNFINKNIENNILAKLSNDYIGNIHRTDETILNLGAKFF